MDKNPTAIEKKMEEPWPQVAINEVLDNTALQTGDQANRLLVLSGLSKKRASLSAIRSFAKWYQAGLDQNMEAIKALKHAKDNWQNNGGKNE